MVSRNTTFERTRQVKCLKTHMYSQYAISCTAKESCTVVYEADGTDILSQYGTLGLPGTCDRSKKLMSIYLIMAELWRTFRPHPYFDTSTRERHSNSVSPVHHTYLIILGQALIPCVKDFGPVPMILALRSITTGKQLRRESDRSESSRFASIY